MVVMLHACTLGHLHGCDHAHVLIMPWLHFLIGHLNCGILYDTPIRDGFVSYPTRG